MARTAGPKKVRKEFSMLQEYEERLLLLYGDERGRWPCDAFSKLMNSLVADHLASILKEKSNVRTESND